MRRVMMLILLLSAAAFAQRPTGVTFWSDPQCTAPPLQAVEICVDASQGYQWTWWLADGTKLNVPQDFKGPMGPAGPQGLQGPAGVVQIGGTLTLNISCPKGSGTVQGGWSAKGCTAVVTAYQPPQ